MRNFMDLVEALIHTLRVPANDNKTVNPMSEHDWDDVRALVQSMRREIKRNSAPAPNATAFFKGQQIKIADRPAKVMRINGTRLAVQFEDGSIGHVDKADPRIAR